MIYGADVSDRFWKKVDADGDCWQWTACRDANGYGRFGIGSRVYYAHRVAWQILVGEISKGLVIDHLCRNKSCVNPDHMEPVTIGENVARGPARLLSAQVRAKITHCPCGHPYDDVNTYVTRRGERACRTCKNASSRKRAA